jgi:FMN phosphatase YigB (HAD superfamily)
MSGVLPQNVCGVSLDLGNTIYPLRAQEMAQTIRHLHRFLEERLGEPLPFDTLEQLYREIRERQFTENRPTLRENDFEARLREMISAVHAPPSDELLREASDSYAAGFVHSLQLPEGAKDTIHRLWAAYGGQIVICSNFILSSPIRQLLIRDGLMPYLQAVVVSCDIGFVKPHPAMFAAVAEALELAPSEIAHVGDDLDADINGGRLAGMTTVYTTEWIEPHSSAHHIHGAPDVTIANFSELAPSDYLRHGVAK